MLSSILARGNHNRLDTALVKTGLASEVGSDLNETEEQGYLALYAIVGGGKRPDAVSGALEAAIGGLREAGPTADELSEAKNELLTEALGNRETFSGRAFELGEALVRTGDPKAADKRLAGISAVTVADVRRVAQTYLNPARRVEFSYTKGSGDAKQWANPIPLPVFKSAPTRNRAPERAAAGSRARSAARPGRQGRGFAAAILRLQAWQWGAGHRGPHRLSTAVDDDGPDRRGLGHRSARQGRPCKPCGGHRRPGHADA